MTYLVIATYNRADLLIPQLKKLIEDRTLEVLEEVLVYDNGKQKSSGLYDLDHPKITVINQGWNAGCSITWNEGLKEAFKKGAHQVIVYNDDCEWHPHPNYLKIEVARAKRDEFSISSTKGFTSFMVTKEVYAKMSKYKEFFDESFYPAYYEDNDADIRLKLNGIKVTPSAFLEPDLFRGSQTIKKEPKVNANFEKNKKYYMEKWNGLPGREMLSWEKIKAHAEITEESSVLIVGPQRSGTTYATSVIADHYNLKPIYEEVTGSYWKNALEWVKESDLRGSVIQAPTLSSFAGELSPKVDFIFFMWRDSKDIEESVKRINWVGANQLAEWEPYKTKESTAGKKIWDYKKSYWADHKPQNGFWLRYESFKEEPSWVPKFQRKNFNPRQIKL